ncbi:hypothetical protein J2W42_001293 [Rhizobium tibeticum]|uniref:DUF995 domain-containing protein n=1 Tax=Rhizobium tibeticum TaxID=501024 RepID=A0A1H8CBT0_9HYPH|nr:hypothetical protein [Rhizobium tibeticum]MDP9808455.1 hypothetical protein [Rhizobium tibeticum]SEH46450.1 hypothetical protein RTCCBAU85039_0535 [Rhizobium tibeticum]SEM92543.1 hypothetical protein SAMN05216228_100187 [Rhizobium tibeticum]
MRVVISALATTLAICSPAAAAEKMTGKELTALLGQGKELMLGGPGKGYQGSLTLDANGTAMGQVKLDSGQVIPIEGVWAVKKDKFCRTWKGGRDAGKEICETWVKTGPKSVEVIVGKRDLGTNSWN